MKNGVPIVLASAMLVFGAASASAGEAEAHMAVRLSVGETCSISATPMEFAMESGGGASARGQASVALACSPRTAYEIAIDRGENAAGDTRRMANPETGAMLEYEVYRDAARTARWGDRPGGNTVGGRFAGSGPVVHVAYGEVIPRGEVIAAGTYADMLVVTVSF